MRQNATVQKKCLECGHIYDECEHWLGVAKCPKCFKAERFIRVDRKGSPVKEYERDIVDYLYGHPKDNGCKYSPTCQQCPFEEGCLEDLSAEDRQRCLKQWIQARIEEAPKKYQPIIEYAPDAIRMYDEGMSPDRIAEILGKNVSSISKCLSERRKYEQNLVVCGVMGK